MIEILPSGLPEVVADDELVARFLRSSSQFTSVAVKATAFLPGKDETTSVARHGAEPRQDLWHLAETFLGSGARVHGAAICSAATVRESLDVIAMEPPPRHASIVGWPRNADPEMQKAHRKELALVIASQSVLVRNES